MLARFRIGRHPTSMSTPENHLRIDYVEFAVRDVAAAKKFYQSVFSWVFTDYGPDYTSFHDGRMSGGFRADPNGVVPTNPLIVIFSLDLERIEAAVRSAGGKIVIPPHEFPGGRRFHFMDSNGLELAVWSDHRADGTKIV
jgi:predicted enzyme related to lactoylglutathione lyase